MLRTSHLTLGHRHRICITVLRLEYLRFLYFVFWHMTIVRLQPELRLYLSAVGNGSAYSTVDHTQSVSTLYGIATELLSTLLGSDRRSGP